MLKKGNGNCLFTTAKRSSKSYDSYSSLNVSVALGRSQVPFKHKQLASNYVLIKKVFGSCAAVIPITNADKAVLSRHGFMTLENTTISQMNHQIEQLKSWCNGGDILLETYANELFEIRIKELKYLRLIISSGRAIEFQDGFKALEKYVEYIAG